MNLLKGLVKSKKDLKDFSHSKTFGSITDFVNNFQVGKTVINDQGSSDLCTAESSSEVAGDLFDQDFSPEYSFAKEKQIQGNANEYGADLKTALKAAVQYGFLPRTNSPFTLAVNGRTYIANWNNWSINLDSIAAQFRIGGYFAVDGPADTFDNIRSAMQMQNVTVFAGSNWYGAWEQAVGGIIPETYDTNFPTLHAFKIFGWKQIGDQPYLMIQNSEGEFVGDHGIFYMSRAVANNELKDGLYYFTKDKPTAPQLVGNWFTILLQTIFHI